MPLSPLWLEAVTYDHIEVRMRQDHRPGTDFPFAMTDTRNVALLDSDQRRWRVDLRVEIGSPEDDPPPPYDIDIAVSGLLLVHPTWPEEKQEELVAINGASLLYSGLRDFVLTLTSRSRWGPLLLPTHRFDFRRKPSTEEAEEHVLELLRQLGPAAPRKLDGVSELDPDTLRQTLRRLAAKGRVERTGRGAGVRYGV